MTKEVVQGKQLKQALLLAQKAISTVAKDAKNTYHKYDYVSAESMIESCRSALHSAGLTASRGEWSVDDQGRKLQMYFELAHAESGESARYAVEWPVVEDKGRPFDKAVAGALTTSFNYWLRDILLVPRKDDHEIDRRDDTAHVPAAKPPKAAPQPKKEPAKAAPSGFDPANPTMRQVLDGLLKSRNIPADAWEEIRAGMAGKPSSQLEVVWQEIKARRPPTPDEEFAEVFAPK